MKNDINETATEMKSCLKFSSIYRNNWHRDGGQYDQTITPALQTTVLI